MSKTLLTVIEVALRLKASERFVLDELRRKNLRGSKTGAGWRITEADIETYLDAKAERLARAEVGMTTPEPLVDEVPAPAPFGDQDRAILEFERLRFLTSGSKHTEILDRFAMTPVRYYIRLNWILGGPNAAGGHNPPHPEALTYDPVLVRHLVELRDKRRDVRTRGTVAAGVESRPDPRGTRPALLVEVTR